MGRGIPACVGERRGRKERKIKKEDDGTNAAHLPLSSPPLPSPPLPPLTRMYGKARATVKLANQFAVVPMVAAAGRAS